MIQLKYGDIKMKGQINSLCVECGVIFMSVAEKLAAKQKISLREATKTLFATIYKSIPIWEEKENRP